MMKVNIPKSILDLYSTCYKKNGDFNSRKFSSILNKNEEIKSWFDKASETFKIEVTPLLVFYSSIVPKLSYYEPVLCKQCGKVLTAPQIKNHSYCSFKCAAQSDEVRNKTKKTMLQRYGSEHPLQVKEFKNKFKETCLDRYGSKNPFSLEVVQKKIKKTLLDRYGVDNPLKSEAIKEKVAKTNKERYGARSPLQNSEVKAKVFKTNIERYGTYSPLGSKEIQAKSKETWQKTLGVNNPAKSSIIFNRIKETNLKRYGVEIPSKNKEVVAKLRKTQRINFYESFADILAARKIQVLTNKQDYIEHKPLSFKCLRCGNEWVNENNEYGDNYQHIYCKKCLIDKFSSNGEKDLLQFIKNNYFGEIVENSRKIIKGRELDIYLPEKKLAIEFDGTFYHSSKYKDYRYHQEKTLACREQGIRLIHIFEHEWSFKREKVCNLLRNALGIFDHQIYARQCRVKELSTEEYKLFLEINHFNGFVNSSIRYGLFYNDELVSVIGFGKSRFKKEEIELHRYCVKVGYKVIGGFSKLLKHSGQTYFFSYVDLAHFDGKGYDALGFKLVKITKPSYIYVKKSVILSRIACQKHKLNNLLEKFDPNMTEQQNMLANGYMQIYDAGNLKLEYKI